jgi:RHS repeat-associated protein
MTDVCDNFTATWRIRFLTWIIIVTQLAVPFIGTAGPVDFPTRESSRPQPPPTAQSPVLSISKDLGMPTSWSDQEIFNFAGFSEPLVPSDKPSSLKENKALLTALGEYRARKERDDISALLRFLDDYPDSTWRIALLANIGMTYRYGGYYSRALTVLEQTWRLGKAEKGQRVRNVIDVVIGELLELNARLGRYDQLQTLFKEVDGRPLRGRATESLTKAREGAWSMKTRPQESFLCGPYALQNVFRQLNPSNTLPAVLVTATSSPNGTSLTELEDLAGRSGMKFRMVRRKSGTPLLVPSVIHWKSGHFAAILSQGKHGFLVKDPTFNQETWITRSAIDDESSGFFLVDARTRLPQGWKHIGTREGSNIWGKGRCDSGDDRETRPCDKKTGGNCPGCPGGEPGLATYSFHTLLVSLNIIDTPVRFVPPRGPVFEFTATYNQREAGQPPNFTFANLGPKWSCGLVSYISDWETSQGITKATYHDPGGGYETYTPSGVVQQPPTEQIDYATQQKTRSKLAQLPFTQTPGFNDTGSKYELTFADGSMDVFERSNDPSTNPSNRRFFRTKSIDAQGNQLTYYYDANLRLLSLQNQLLHTMSFAYSGTDTKITQVTITVGSETRTAKLDYDSTGRLVRITDAVGLTSEFEYEGDSDFINAMITPYGRTTFSKNPVATGEAQPDRWLTATDPLGQQEKIVYKVGMPETAIPGESIPGSIPRPAGMDTTVDGLGFRNTLYWDKKAMQSIQSFDVNNPDYSKARIFHWLHLVRGINGAPGLAAGVLESEKLPLERRIWYNYPNQTDPGDIPSSVDAIVAPTKIGRVLDNGSTQLYQFTYNDAGRVETYTDPLDLDSQDGIFTGRRTSFTYAANNIDLLEIRQTTPGIGGAPDENALLATFTYKPGGKHLVETATDASGRIAQFQYNDFGELTLVTNPRGESIAFDPDPASGFLRKIVLPSVSGATEAQRTTTFLPDAFFRAASVTDGEGYMRTFQYDNLDRLIRITYEDDTTEQIVFDKLDPVLTKDRSGRWMLLAYDALRRLVMVKDTLGRTTRLEWCSCDGLTSLVDALGQITTWDRDLQGRVMQKIYSDGSKVKYDYEAASGRLKSVTDAKGQVIQYSYQKDDNVTAIRYTSPVPTPSVTFAYDSKYNRLTNMSDGIGTTIYDYYPIPSAIPTPAILGAGRLKTINGALAIDGMTFGYDELGRVTSRTNIDLSSPPVSRVSYDSLGRVSSANNLLGAFTYGYENASPRIATVTFPNSQTTTFTYFPSSNLQNQQRLQTIWHKRSDNSTISRFEYDFDAEGTIKTITQWADSNPSTFYSYSYDAEDQLLMAGSTNGTPATPLTWIKRFVYSYDPAANRASEHSEVNGGSTVSATFAHNNLNELTKRRAGERLQFLGTIQNEQFQPKSVTINGAAAKVTASGQANTWNYDGYATVSSDSPVATIIATDTSGNSKTNKYEISNITANGANKTLVYDLNGNLTTCIEGDVKDTFEWDAENRLVAIERFAISTSTRTSRSEFSYDGYGRRVRIVERNGAGAITSDKRFVWCGPTICQELNGAGTSVTKHYFPQGVKQGTSIYYYTHDDLGSIREMTDGNGVIQARYEYDPYGKRTKIAGALDIDFGFTGHYFHPPSGLYFALYRAYDSDLGIWLSRDLIEQDSPNLYSYVENDPANYIDELGDRRHRHRNNSRYRRWGDPERRGLGDTPPPRQEVPLSAWPQRQLPQSQHPLPSANLGEAIPLPGGPIIVRCPSKAAARRAADREAGIGKHGQREPLPPEPLRPLSRSPTGEPGMRESWTNPERPPHDRPTVHNDPYGHRFGDGSTIAPHYQVDHPTRPTVHFTYPSAHNPQLNR